MPARFGTGGSSGRRITGDDMPLYAHPEEIEKIDVDRALQLSSNLGRRGKHAEQRRAYQVASRAQRRMDGDQQRHLQARSLLDIEGSERGGFTRAARRRGISQSNIQYELFARSDAGRSGRPNPWPKAGVGKGLKHEVGAEMVAGTIGAGILAGGAYGAARHQRKKYQGSDLQKKRQAEAKRIVDARMSSSDRTIRIGKGLVQAARENHRFYGYTAGVAGASGAAGYAAGRRRRRRPVEKGLIPSFSALKTSAKTVGPMKTAGAVGSMVKPKIQSGFNAATSTRNRTLATGGTAGLATGVLMSPRQSNFGKAREYDYDRNRNRRLGAAEAGLVLTGGYAGHKGIQGTREETKRMRDAKIRTAVGGKDKSLGEVYGRRALAISRRNALLIGGGAAAIGAAGGVHQWGNSNKGRVWR